MRARLSHLLLAAAALLAAGCPADAQLRLSWQRPFKLFDPQGGCPAGRYAYAPSAVNDGRTMYVFHCGNRAAGEIVDVVRRASWTLGGGTWTFAGDVAVLYPSLGDAGMLIGDVGTCSASECGGRKGSGHFSPVSNRRMCTTLARGRRSRYSRPCAISLHIPWLVENPAGTRNHPWRSSDEM
ncbi:hypothetical protein DFJ74DRAFT_478126 [Hyaloraphidium curvatum]|nr:hypothetical protein DFJ74DRAFT_478126 [Hyaloraphidium curvatum]